MVGETERQIFEKGFEDGYDRGRIDSDAGKMGYAGVEKVMNKDWERYKSRKAMDVKAGVQ